MLDAHAHLQLEGSEEEVGAGLDASARAGVRGVVLADYDRTRRARMRALADRPGVWFCLGLHPWAIDCGWRGELQMLTAASFEGAVGVGECGLDWVVAKSALARECQRDVLRAQIAIALERRLPLVLHCVRAEDELLKVLRSEGAQQCGGMVHGFQGSWAQARRFLDLGFDLSWGPRAMYRDSPRARETVEQVPLDSLLVETDSPSSARGRGSRTEPADVVGVVRWLAEVRGCEPSLVGAAAEHNARRRFRLGDEVLTER